MKLFQYKLKNFIVKPFCKKTAKKYPAHLFFRRQDAFFHSRKYEFTSANA